MVASQCVIGQSFELTEKYSDFSPIELITELENDFAIKVYYQKADLDSIDQKRDYTGLEWKSAIRLALSDSDLIPTFIDNKVFIIQGRSLRVDLPILFKEGDQLPDETSDKEMDYYQFDRNNEVGTRKQDEIIHIGKRGTSSNGELVELRGKITDKQNGEAIVGAAIIVDETGKGTITDPLGFFKLTLPSGAQKVHIKSLGMSEVSKSMIIHSSGTLNVELESKATSLNEVVVEAERGENINSTEMGRELIDIKTIKSMPALMGEQDVVKVIMTLPGVKSVGEATSGFNVRGGGADQNLILYNDAVVFNPTHLFGFFSSFNPDVLGGTELFKSSIPANFGGRLSSVLQVESRQGNLKKFTGSGGVGLMTARLTLEGPIIKERTSFITSFRTTYSDWILDEIKSSSFQNSAGNFYDFDLGISHKVNDKNTVSASTYLSQDEFSLSFDTTYNYSNRIMSIEWVNVKSDDLLLRASTGFSHYSYSIKGDRIPENSFKLGYSMNLINPKLQGTYFGFEGHTIDVGIESRFTSVKPGFIRPVSNESLIEARRLSAERALENSLFLSDSYDFNESLTVSAGLRQTFYSYIGPKDVLKYGSGQPISEYNVTDTVSMRGVIKRYGAPEIRLSARYLLDNRTSLKASFNTMRQYIHLVSNSTAISPTDIWKLSDSYIRPQQGSQLSLGVYRSILRNTVEGSFEVYYKRFQNYLDYRSGAVLLLNESLEQDVFRTKGRSYGFEFLLKKPKGRLNGWIAYTYSRSLLKQSERNIGELINNGEFYPSNFDIPHEVSLISNYKFSHRIGLSFNFIYFSGRPITVPIGKFNYGNSERVYYSDRNEFRIPDYYRIDVGVNIEGNHKIRKLAHSSWNISIYNLTARKNPYSIYFLTNGEGIQGYKLSVFARAIPTITYNFKF